MRKSVCVSMLFALSVWATAALAADAPSLEQGKALFENEKLGTNGKSCATCHMGGKKLEWAATYDEEKLAGIVNQCVKQALKGTPLAADSDEMKSMVMYIKTFAGPGK